MSDESRLKELEEQLIEVNARQEKLWDEHCSIEAEIREIKSKRFKITNELLNLQKGSNIIAVNTHTGSYHYCMFECYKVVDMGNVGTKCIRTTYREDDGEYSVSCSRSSIPHAYWHSLYEDSHDLFTVSDDDYQTFLESLYNLEVEYDTAKKFIGLIQSKAITRIQHS